MYAVEVSDHIMIAHSFRGAVFGPAQALHGATFAISVAFLADKLDENGIVVDIGRAHDVLKSVLGPLKPITPEEVELLKVSFGRNEYRIAKTWEHYREKARQAGLL